MRRLLPGLLVWLLLIGAVGAQTLPLETEVLVEGRLFETREQALDGYQRLRKVPLFQVLFDLLRREGGLDIGADLLAPLEGTLVMGVVRMGETSPFYEVYQREQARTDYRTVVSDLRSLGGAIDSFVTENERLPNDLEELVPDYLFELPTAPDGVAYRYTVNPDGSWKLVSVFDADSRVARAGEPPVYDEYGVAPEEPSLRPGPYNVVVALRLDDSQRAAAVMTRLFGTEPPWQSDLGSELGTVTAVVSNGWLVLTDEAALVKPSLAALTGKAPLASANPRLRSQRAALSFERRSRVQLTSDGTDPDFFGFVDIAGIRAHWPGPVVSDSMVAGTYEAFKSFGVAYYVSEDEIVSEGLLEMEPPAGHPLADLFDSRGATHFPVLGLVPWKASNVIVADLKELLAILETAAEIQPVVGMAMGFVTATVETNLNLSFHDELVPATSGELLFSFERLDFIAAGLRAMLVAQPPPEEGQDTSEPGWLELMPLTVALGLEQGPARSEVVSRLQDLVGDDAIRYDYAGTPVVRSANGLMAFAVSGDYLLISGGGTLRQLEAMLETAAGKTPALPALETYSQFEKQVKGNLLFYSHEKVDWIYSIIKGLVLFLGAEFRDEAVDLGRWRDSYSAVSLDQKGIRLLAVIYAKEQVPR